MARFNWGLAWCGSSSGSWPLPLWRSARARAKLRTDEPVFCKRTRKLMKLRWLQHVYFLVRAFFLIHTDGHVIIIWEGTFCSQFWSRCTWVLFALLCTFNKHDDQCADLAFVYVMQHDLIYMNFHFFLGQQLLGSSFFLSFLLLLLHLFFLISSFLFFILLPLVILNYSSIIIQRPSTLGSDVARPLTWIADRHHIKGDHRVDR